MTDIDERLHAAARALAALLRADGGADNTRAAIRDRRRAAARDT